MTNNFNLIHHHIYILFQVSQLLFGPDFDDFPRVLFLVFIFHKADITSDVLTPIFESAQCRFKDFDGAFRRHQGIGHTAESSKTIYILFWDLILQLCFRRLFIVGTGNQIYFVSVIKFNIFL